MKKIFISIGTIFTILLMISTVTAVPQVNSNPLMEKINEIEDNKKTIDEKLRFINLDIENGGLIDFLLQIIELLLAFILLILGNMGRILHQIELPLLYNLTKIIFYIVGYIHLFVLYIRDLINR